MPMCACRYLQVAFYWEGNDVGQQEFVSYQQLLDMVCQVSNILLASMVQPHTDRTPNAAFGDEYAC